MPDWKELDDADAIVRDALPWFLSRMMSDVWCFGLLVTSGHVIAIETITRIMIGPNAELFADVQLAETEKYYQISGGWPDKILFAPTERRSASINLAHVIAAVELAYT